MKRLDPKTASADLGRALYVEGQRIMTDSKANYVPVRDNPLRASGHVQPPVVSGTRSSVTLGFGGAASAYALVQHERTDYRHTVGTSKYLETPVHNAARGLAARLGKNLDLF